MRILPWVQDRIIARWNELPDNGDRTRILAEEFGLGSTQIRKIALRPWGGRRDRRISREVVEAMRELHARRWPMEKIAKYFELKADRASRLISGKEPHDYSVP